MLARSSKGFGPPPVQVPLFRIMYVQERPRSPTLPSSIPRGRKRAERLDLGAGERSPRWLSIARREGQR